MRPLPLLLILASFVAPVAACGDVDEVGRAGDQGAGFSVGTGAPDTIAAVGTGDLDAIAADMQQSYLGFVGPDATYDTMLEMWSDRCRTELDLESMREDENELWALVQGVEIVDVTVRRIEGKRAEVEIISTDAEGVAEGALVWADILLEDGHWRADDCEVRTTFTQAGATIEAPVSAPITEADEENIARSIEAQYLGEGTAAEAWDFLSIDCRETEWGNDRDAHDSAFARLGSEIAGQGVTFSVEHVTLEPSTDTSADASLILLHNGLRVDVTDTQSLHFELEDGRWRYDDCT